MTTNLGDASTASGQSAAEISNRTNPLFWLSSPDQHSDGRLAAYTSRRTPRDLPAEMMMEDAAKERHRIYASMLMGLTYYFWNGNRFGVRVTYPLNPVPDPRHGIGEYLNDTYLGHNIAALAVDYRGNIVEFDFNHNAAFASSAEHAENRLVRRLFRIANSSTSVWEISRPVKVRPGVRSNSSKLNLVTIYTSLESCAQCSGTMAMGSVRQVVYLQPDPGAFFIGNVMYNLGRTRDNASGNPTANSPLPIAGDQIDFKPYLQLAEAYRQFAERPDAERFCPEVETLADGQSGPKDTTLSSFLCTRRAWEIYKAEADAFEARGSEAKKRPKEWWDSSEAREYAKRLELGAPNWRPPDLARAADAPPLLTNFECLIAAYDFLQIAKAQGQRGIARGG